MAAKKTPAAPAASTKAPVPAKTTATPAAKQAAKDAAEAPKPVKRPTAKDMKQHAQTLPYPAKQADMKLQPQSDLASYKAAGKLKDKIAIITGPTRALGGPWPWPSPRRVRT